MVIDHIDPTRQASLDSAAILKHSTIALEDGLMREGSDWIPEGREGCRRRSAHSQRIRKGT